MQAENQTNSDFLRRTDTLAVRLGLRLSDLPHELGISKAMLFAYRKDQAISGKAWEKLRAAEERAGISYASAAESGIVLREDAAEYRTKSDPERLPGIPEMMRMIKEQVSPQVADEVERLLLEHQRERLRMEANEFFGCVGALADEARRSAAMIDDEETADNLMKLGDAVEKLAPNIETLVESLTKPKP